MKKLLICTLCLLLSSCSLFQTTPDAVIKGQRAVYQSALINEANVVAILKQYESDCKKLITYHANYVFQLKLLEIEARPVEEESWRPSKTEQKKSAELKRDSEIKSAFVKLEARVNNLRLQAKKNHDIGLRLIGSVYNYLSTSPIELDNMEFWINKLEQLSKEEVK